MDDTVIPERDIKPQNADVLLGRGKKYSTHPGNVMFNDLVVKNRDLYFATDDPLDRRFVVRNIIDSAVKKGRFLKLVSDTWVKASDDCVYLKVTQAIQYRWRKRASERSGHVDTRPPTSNHREDYSFSSTLHPLSGIPYLSRCESPQVIPVCISVLDCYHSDMSYSNRKHPTSNTGNIRSDACFEAQNEYRYDALEAELTARRATLFHCMVDAPAYRSHHHQRQPLVVVSNQSHSWFDPFPCTGRIAHTKSPMHPCPSHQHRRFESSQCDAPCDTSIGSFNSDELISSFVDFDWYSE